MSPDDVSRGDLTFEAETPPAFVDLVEQTLEQSEYIYSTRVITDEGD
ncbi:MAG: hypothetical protein ACI8XM_000023 [Haloarculaceae archaeon]|jgi:hypothetical protein